MFNIKSLCSRLFSASLTICLSVGAITFSTPVRVMADKSNTVSWPVGPELYGEAACLIEASTGTVLYEKNSHNRMYPASITKILTALVTIENCELDEEVYFSEECVNSLSYDDANMAMQAGEILPVEDCLYGLMLKSANEVATALGEHVSGSTEEFAKLMTERAKEAGALDSNFMNANGLHNDNHYITAYDMCMITRAAVSNPVFLTISGTTGYTISASNYKDPFEIYNRHKMLFSGSGFYYEGILGGKTGFTDQAGTTLVTYAQRDGMTLIAVVLHSNGYNVYNDTALLFDYGFDNFHLVNAANNEHRFEENTADYTDKLTPLFGDNDTSSMYIDSSSNIVLPESATFDNVTSSISYDNNSTMDESGDYIIATLNYTLGDHNVGSANILLDGSSIHTSAISSDNKIADDSSTTNNNTPTKKFSFKMPSIKINKGIVKAVTITLAIIILLTVVIVLIRKKQKQLNEVRARKRRRNY